MTTYNISAMPRTIIRRKVPTMVWVIAWTIITPILLAFLAGAGIGIYQGATGHKIIPSHTDTVKDFNEGFADSKQDDCEQGFAPACAWLEAK